MTSLTTRSSPRRPGSCRHERSNTRQRKNSPAEKIMRFRRMALATLVLIASSAVFSSAHPARASERPNIVVFLADDQGWGDLSVHGDTNLHTPHTDALARDGAWFEHFYVCPVC